MRARVRQACERSGRSVEEVTIVAVAKTFGPEDVMRMAAAGLTLFGENRVQEARQKIPLCSGSLEWHLVGHLQRNKVRDAVRLFSMVHSADSVRLLEALEGACAAAGKTLPVCLEVNVSGESSKQGLKPEEVPTVLDRCGGLRNVEVVGLMTIPPFAPEPEAARPFYRRLRELREAWRAGSGFPLEHLSIGMSNDFEVAVEEGATLVRLGTVLFGPRGRRARQRGPG